MKVLVRKYIHCNLWVKGRDFCEATGTQWFIQISLTTVFKPEHEFLLVTHYDSSNSYNQCKEFLSMSLKVFCLNTCSAPVVPML